MNAYNDDVLEIQKLVLAYSFAASKGDIDSLAATFAEDGVLAGFAVLVGRTEAEIFGQTAIKEVFEGFLPNIEFIHQMSQTGRVDITGETATAEVMVTEYVRWKGQDLSLFLGRYADDLIRTEQGWRFAKRTLLPRAALQIKGDVMVF